MAKAKKNTDDHFELSSFSKIKKGEYFRFKGGKKVYKFEGGGKVRGFKYASTDDIYNTKETKTDRVIEIGFTY